MNLDLIKSFAVLAETSHFGDAARHLKISQPSLTKQIRRLEDVLGAPLFARDRQGTMLTAFGRQLLAEIEPVLRHADHVWEKSLRAARGERGRLAIGFTYSSAAAMADIVHKFQKHHPEVELIFDDVSSQTQVERIREGSLDVGFMRRPNAVELSFLPLVQDRIAFVFPGQLAGEIRDFDSKGVCSLAFIGLKPGLAPGLESCIQKLFASRGFAPSLFHRVNGPMTQLALVAAGLGAALMHESALRHGNNFAEGVVVRPILDPVAIWSEGLAWRHEETNPVVARFMAIAHGRLPERAGSFDKVDHPTTAMNAAHGTRKHARRKT